MLRPSSISASTPQREDTAKIQDMIRSMVNSMVIGKVETIANGLATIDIHNTKALDCQIYQNAPGNNVDIDGYYFQSLGKITVRYVCLAYLFATPQPGDTVIAFVPQSSIEAFFDGSNNNYGGDFPLAESLVIPVKTGYTNNTEMVINPQSNLVPNVVLNAPNLAVTSTTGEIDATNFKINCSAELQLIATVLLKMTTLATQINTTKLAIVGNGGEVLAALIVMLTALGAATPVPPTTIDELTGGAITTFITFLSLFLG
jgi:hypothetical protein